MAAWLAGEAAQLAIASNRESKETITATSLFSFLPDAFRAIDQYQ
jgi:hypothetical protein